MNQKVDNKTEQNNTSSVKKSEWKKNLKIAIAMLLVAVISVGGTLAFLSDESDTKENVFLGSAGIDLTINETFEDDKAEQYTPGMEIIKAPTLTNSSESEYYEWVALKVSYKKITSSSEIDGKTTYATTDVNYSVLTENVINAIVFNTATDNASNNKWVKIKDGGTYSIFVYQSALPQNGITSALFEKVNIKDPVKDWDGNAVTNEDLSQKTKSFPNFRIDVAGAAIQDEDNGETALNFYEKYNTTDTTEKKICDELIRLLNTNT